MKILLAILCIVTCFQTFPQQFTFSEEGTQKRGFAILDTIIKSPWKLKTSMPLVFKHIDTNRTIVFDKDTLNSNLKFIKISDSAEYFILINNSTKTISFNIQDGSLITIKEALNINQKLLPIEFWEYSWCGNSYLRYILLPGHLLVFKTKKSLGDYATKIRLRFKTESHGVLLSNFFDGFLQHSQFIPNPSLERYNQTNIDRIDYLK